MSKHIVAVDIGGTFSDLVCLDTATGEIRNAKVPSTPPTFIDGVINALDKVGIDPLDMLAFKHGSTIATNAIIERRGAKTALVTTEGFRDVLGAGRADRTDHFDLSSVERPPLVPRRDVLGVRERVDYEGAVVAPLDPASMQRAIHLIRRREMEAVAVVFLNSFMNKEHEYRALAAISEALPEVYACCSYDILPELKEFERTSTTAVNAYLGPIVDRYLSSLTERLARWGFRGQTMIIHSGGGVMSLDAARRLPARTCMSGPAGGAVGAAYIGRLAGYSNLISFDMGGTSCDVALISGGEPGTRPGWKIEHKVPVQFPAIDVGTIGAGGGTIAWIDKAGALRSGPQSAGADPGPAAYGSGGEEPTNTDANLVLGRLDPEAFLGGEFKLHPELAREAIQRRVAEPLGFSIEEAAEGILRVSNENMVEALRLISVERGNDPRDYALIAFGGAGPVHAAHCAAELSIPTVIVPRSPGLASAFGQLRVEIRDDTQRPLLTKHDDVDPAELEAVFSELEDEAEQLLRREGVAGEEVQLQRSVDLKYYPQTSYINLRVPSGHIDQAVVDDLVSSFLERHADEFGYSVGLDLTSVEFVNARLTALAPAPVGELVADGARGAGADAVIDTREVHFGEAGGWVLAGVYDRTRLFQGASFDGPAIVQEADSTTIVPPRAHVQVDRHRNLIIDVREVARI
ncbi:MAG: hydantoinase/oxoprolinase family protein [Solirubrobacterales bacterium]|nr:hydantoinase/oxoprolinase family protein [Solirubrobacterales bacterium]